MGIPIVVSGFFETLIEAFKIFFRNGKLIPSITLLNISINSIIMLSYLFTIKLLFTDYSTKLTQLTLDDLTTHDDQSFSLHTFALMKREFLRFIAASLTIAATSALVSFFFAIAVVIASAEIILGRKSNRPVIAAAEELVSMARRSWGRALVTFAHTTLLGLGYAFFVWAFIVFPLQLISLDPLRPSKIPPFSTAALVLVAILYSYLSVVWTLALVVSVLEEKRGFEALWKASELAEGLRLKGFLLKLLFGGLSFVAGFRVLSLEVYMKALIGKNSNVLPFILLVTISSVIGMFSLISYTVLYFEGKKIHPDEVIEMKGYDVQYAEVPASASDIIP